jgi:hypothetical protein
MNEDGFEYQGTFYRYHCSDMGKDLMLIDRFAGLPITDFFALIEDDFERGRAPILLALIATSIRNGHPDWSVERIVRTVLDLNLSEIKFVEAEQEEVTLPLPASREAPPETSEPWPSPSNGSSSSSIPPASSTSETSSATPA